ncbi:hypothetical protein KKF38_00775, partial [Patescibacteria group bacterium]|nr:hypothetical protein [Patescibacteria group bacterium]
MQRQFFDFDAGSLRERRLVFEAAENLEDLQTRAAGMSQEEAYDQLTLEEFQAANKAGWFSNSIPPIGSRANTEKPNLKVIKEGKTPEGTKDTTEGLEDAKKAEYPDWMQKELARMDGNIKGNIMDV